MAHGSSVNCLALNHSGRTLATGGDDRKVNLWNTGKPNLLVVSRTRLSKGLLLGRYTQQSALYCYSHFMRLFVNTCVVNVCCTLCECSFDRVLLGTHQRWSP